MDLAEALAATNAVLSAATVVLLVSGYRAIKRKERARHRALMTGAFACSAVFLVLFTIRFVTFGFRHFDGTSTAAKAAYYTVLFAHEPIAVLSVPLGLVTFGLGLFNVIKAHKELAKMTLVMWLISASTGVLFYLLLYVVF